MDDSINLAPQKNSRWTWGLLDFFWGIAPLLIGVQLLAWIFFLPQSLHGHTSFRQLYTAGYMVRTGHARELYDYDTQKHFQDQLVSRETVLMPFIRPPFDALVFVPFSFLSYPSAYVAFLVLSVILLVVAVRLLRPWTDNLRASRRLLPLAIFASFVPVAAALMLGQDSILLLTLLSASMYVLNEEQDFAAGALAGLGLFKFHLLIPMALLMLCWKKFRFVGGFSLTAAALALISVVVASPRQIVFYARSLLNIGQGGNGSAHELLRYPLPITMMASVHGLVNGLSSTPSTTRTVVTVLLVLSILAWVAIAVPKNCLAQWMVPIASTTAVLVSYYLFIYDLTLLLLPLVFALNRAATRDKRDRLLSAAGVLVFLAPACLILWTDYFYLVSLPVFFFLFMLVRSAKNECLSGRTAPI